METYDDMFTEAGKALNRLSTEAMAANEAMEQLTFMTRKVPYCNLFNTTALGSTCHTRKRLIKLLCGMFPTVQRNEAERMIKQWQAFSPAPYNARWEAIKRIAMREMDEMYWRRRPIHEDVPIFETRYLMRPVQTEQDKSIFTTFHSSV